MHEVQEMIRPICSKCGRRGDGRNMVIPHLCVGCFVAIDADVRFKQFTTYGENWKLFIEALI